MSGPIAKKGISSKSFVSDKQKEKDEKECGKSYPSPILLNYMSLS